AGANRSQTASARPALKSSVQRVSAARISSFGAACAATVHDRQTERAAMASLCMARIPVGRTTSRFYHRWQRQPGRLHAIGHNAFHANISMTQPENAYAVWPIDLNEPAHSQSNRESKKRQPKPRSTNGREPEPPARIEFSRPVLC